MAAGRRAKARAERERLAAVAAAERERRAAAEARRTARRERLLGWVPRPAPVTAGSLAARRRADARVLVAILVALNVLAWFLIPSWAGRVGAAAVSVLVAPVLWTLLFRRS